jgi:regulator of sigma E protease
MMAVQIATYTALKIILGLIGLGVVVFVHELGHFLAARLVKIDVEAFSIGWGNPILKKKVGMVEYRLGMFPFGGYCKMKGETDYNEAWDNMRKGIMPESGSYLAASPAARILVSFAGPFFNLVFAVLLLSIIWGAGFEVNTLENRVVLASEINPAETYPADDAGIKTGDRIIGINGQKISYYHEIHESTTLNPNKPLDMTIERDGEILSVSVTPSLDKSTGAGRIGVLFWADPVIENVKDGSTAQRSGLLPGDTIVSANGQTIRNSADIRKIIDQKPESLVLEYTRNGLNGEAVFGAEDLEHELGFSWKMIHYRTPNLSFPAAVAKGVSEGFNNLAVYIKSLRLLFMGIDLTKAVSGPVRITYMMGDVAAQSFEQGLGAGLRSIMEFVAIISIALFVMNLLPLPILDGGMIILFLVELIRRKPAHPKVISIFQTCGMVIIFCLFVFAIFGDILFFVHK